MTDADEAGWKDVKRKTTDEPGIFQFHLFLTVSMTVILVGENNPVVLIRLNPTVGYGDFMRISAQLYATDGKTDVWRIPPSDWQRAV